MSTNSGFSRIEDNIYLGDQSIGTYTCIEKLMELDIKKVLTIGKVWIKDSEKVSNVYYKHIEEDIEELIIHFADCSQFISEAQNYGESILIHSTDELSVSACVLTAFLMKKYRISAEQAIQRVSQRVAINLKRVLREELNVWQNMSYKLVANYPQLRKYLFRSLRRRLKKMTEENDLSLKRDLFIDSHNQYFRSRLLIEARDQTFRTGQQYHCLKCDSNVLFFGCDVFANDVSGQCQYIYAAPETWNVRVITEKSGNTINYICGQILCRNCFTPLGEYNWNTDNVCKCQLHSGLKEFLVFRYSANKLSIK